MRAVAALLVLTMTACGDDGPSVKVDPDGPPTDADKMIRACAVLDACSDVGLLECVGVMGARGTNRQIDCLLAAGIGNCTTANACVGIRRVPDANCTAGCLDADTVVSCADGVRTENDCPNYLITTGPRCVNGTTSACGAGICSVEDEWTCDGSTYNWCSGGVIKTYDCARVGMQCVPRYPGCVNGISSPCTGPDCDGDFELRCDLENNTTIRLDCTKLIPEGTCVVIDNYLYGCGLGTECNYTSTQPRCIGTTLHACVVGAFKDVDCTSIGGTTCTATPFGGRCSL